MFLKQYISRIVKEAYIDDDGQLVGMNFHNLRDDNTIDFEDAIRTDRISEDKATAMLIGGLAKFYANKILNMHHIGFHELGVPESVGSILEKADMVRHIQNPLQHYNGRRIPEGSRASSFYKKVVQAERIDNEEKVDKKIAQIVSYNIGAAFNKVIENNELSFNTPEPLVRQVHDEFLEWYRSI